MRHDPNRLPTNRSIATFTPEPTTLLVCYHMGHTIDLHSPTCQYQLDVRPTYTAEDQP